MSYFIKRIAGALFAIWGVSTVIFFILHVTSDPVGMLLPEGASQAQYLELRAKMGFDRPLIVQYLDYLQNAVTLDFGASYQRGEPAMEMVLNRYPASLILTGTAVGLALLIGVPLGVAASASRGSWVDQTLSGLAFLGRSIPVFWLAVMMIIVFGVQLRWFPTFGFGSWKHLVLPAATLAVYPLAQFALITRTEMLEVLQQDYVRTATAKGLLRASVIIRHALRNALLPLVTLVGLTFAQLLGGAIITETIFAWPGVGRFTLEAIFQRDFPAIQASVASLATVFVLINLIVDLMYGWLDPRVKLS